MSECYVIITKSRMPAAATQLRNLIKITKVRKASSHEPYLKFKVKLPSPAIIARIWLASRLRHNAFRYCSRGCELSGFALIPQFRHNGTGIQRSHYMHCVAAHWGCPVTWNFFKDIFFNEFWPVAWRGLV